MHSVIWYGSHWKDQSQSERGLFCLDDCLISLKMRSPPHHVACLSNNSTVMSIFVRLILVGLLGRVLCFSNKEEYSEVIQWSEKME